MNSRLPAWLKKRVPNPLTVTMVNDMMRESKLNTVCESARCPNIGECWSKKTATFMILGDICTRNCGFCAIKVGRPLELDMDEPRRVAEAAKEMGLKHVVVTSVARDELPDEGAGHFADTIRALREAIPGVIVEVLTPDFKGKRWCIRRVVDAHPDIYNHNIETVERLSPVVRPQAKYERTLDLLRTVTNMDPTIHTKSGIMLGLGETHEEILQTLRDLREAGVSAVTIGQYLRPTTDKHLPVVEYVHPDRFAEYQRIGDEMGFLFVASGPFVRSSYNAQDFSEKLLSDRLARVGVA
ncbi:MAG: lipoate synthase [Chthonomonadaceae bacterium]|nr:lipoate synthase [Chthonomonadaceae bacterium]